MNGISVIILSLIAVVRVSGGCVDYSPHPNGDCKSFIRCVGNIEYVMTCGKGTVFNPVYKVCDWPRNVECPSSGTTPAPTPEVSSAAPEASTAAPEASTAAPEASTAAPEASTAAPEASTAAPEASTAAPEATTAAPEASTAAPEASTAAPEASTAAPEASTAAPEASTAAPEASTAAPEASTAAPEASTAALEASTAAPEESTAAPEATTPASEVTTATPEVTTESLLYPPCPNNMPMEGKYPDLESKCRSYYVCDKGVVTKKDCPPGLLYEIWTQMCQLENLVTSCKLM